MPHGPCITGWSVISSIGIGRKEFIEGRAQGRSGLRPITGAPVRRAGVVPDFTVQGFLGKKNTRSMDRLTGLAVATAGKVLDDAGLGSGGSGIGADAVGVVLGTTTGSVASISDFTRETVVQSKPFYVNPALFPNTVMNCAAGQTAIRFGLVGPNTTISGGYLSGLLALRYAARIMRAGYSTTMLAGSAEEYCVHRAWGDRHLRSRVQRAMRPLGEGCAMFVLKAPTAAAVPESDALAELVGFQFGVHHSGLDASAGDRADPEPDQDAVARVLARCLRRLLAGAGVAPADVWAVSLGADPVTAAAERAAVDEVLGAAGPEHLIEVAAAVGDTYSAGGALQLAALLATAELVGGPRTRPCLITSVAADGGVGAALVRA